MIGDRMEMPFPTKVHTRPHPFGGRQIIRREVDLEVITREMAVPTEAIRKRVGELPPILPHADVQPPSLDDTYQGYI